MHKTLTPISRVLYGLIATIIVLIPFHAFLTVWFASELGHYTAIRLWKEALLLLVIVLAVSTVFLHPDLRKKLWNNKEFRNIFYIALTYALLVLAAGLFAWAQHGVTAKALGYGLISDLRYVLFFGAAIVAGAAMPHVTTQWRRLLMWPAGAVILFGLLQFTVLPHDVLRHVGYGKDTIPAFTAVDQKPDYARLQSTLRGPNPLGAYLVIVISALVGLFVKSKKKVTYGAAIICALIVLFGTYSRSAWIGAVVAAGIVTFYLASKPTRKYISVAAVVMLLIGATIIIAFRNNDTVQNTFFHTDERSHSSTSSNQNRAGALETGVKDVVHHPLGHGTGTAGPASVYNRSDAKLAENYFIQIGQEVGILGVALFVSLCAMVGVWLWKLREHGLLPIILLGSLVGISIVNLLSHAWADDTLAYVWWGLAGLVMGSYSFTAKDNARGKKPK